MARSVLGIEVKSVGKFQLRTGLQGSGTWGGELPPCSGDVNMKSLTPLHVLILIQLSRADVLGKSPHFS